MTKDFVKTRLAAIAEAEHLLHVAKRDLTVVSWQIRNDEATSREKLAMANQSVRMAVRCLVEGFGHGGVTQ